MPNDTTKIPSGVFNVDLEGLSKVLGENTLTTSTDSTYNVDAEGLARVLNYDVEDQKKEDSIKRTPTDHNVEALIPYYDAGRWLTNFVTHLFTGAESGVVNAEEHARVLGNQQALDWMENPVILGDFPGDPPKTLENPVYTKAQQNPEWKAKEVAKLNQDLHTLGTTLANSTEKIRRRYKDLALMDPQQGFWDSQWESLGMNLPYMVVGGGAAKLGLTGVQLLSEAIAIPAFTLMEAGSHFGDIYATTAKRDEKGDVIPGTGNLEAAKRSIPFGLLAGSLEFWGVSQAVGLIGKLASGSLKDLGIKTFAKELGKVAFAEGGEEISQDFVEQSNKLLEGLQDSYNLRQSAESFLGGAVGGLLLGGFSFSTSLNSLKALQTYAKDLPTEIDKLEKNKIITKEKANKLRNLTTEINNAPLDELKGAIETINNINKEIDTAVNNKVTEVYGALRPRHVERTASAITQAQDVASTRPFLKGTQADQRAQQVMENKALVTAAYTIDQIDKTTDQVPAPNIFDYTVNYGKNKLNSYLEALTLTTEDKDYIEGARKVALLQGASIPALHETTEGIKARVLKDITDRGFIKKLTFVPAEEKGLRNDVALGIALQFSPAEWSFVRHNNRHLEPSVLDNVIKTAQAYQTSPKMSFTALNPRGKMQNEQTLALVQASARKEFFLGARDNIGPIRQETQELLDIRPEEFENLNIGSVGGITGVTISESSIFEDPTYNEEEENLNNLADIGFSSLEETAPPSDVLVIDPSNGITDEILSQVKEARANGIEVKFKTRPMKAVAYKLPNGYIIQGTPGQIHANLVEDIPIQDQADMDRYSGFTDATGRFFYKKEAEDLTRVQGESVRQGVGGMNFPAKYIQGQIQTLEEQAGQIGNIIYGPTYKTVLANYTGNTFSEMYTYLKEHANIDEATLEVIDTFLPVIGNRTFALNDTLAQVTRGKTYWDSGSGKIWSEINPNARLDNPTNVWNTFVHEAIHNYLSVFMHSDTEAAKRFNGRIAGVMQDVRIVLETKDYNSQAFKDLWMGSIEELKAFKSNAKVRPQLAILLYNENKQVGVDEFIASVLSDTQAVKWLTDRIKVGTKSNLWIKIKKIFGGAFSQQGLSINATRKVFEILQEESEYIDIYNRKVDKGFAPKGFNEKTMAEHNILSRNITSGLDNNINIYADPLNDTLDDDQKEDNEENEIENRNIDQFIGFMAAINSATESDWRDYLRTLNDTPTTGINSAYQSYLNDIEETNQSNNNIINRKLERIYAGYKKNFINFEAFKSAFLKRQWLNVVNKSAKDGLIFRGVREINPHSGRIEYSYEINKIKGEYLDGSGKKYNTYKHDILLEEYIPKLEVLLGLPANTFTMTYVEGFEDVFGGEVTGKNNLTGLSGYTLGQNGYEGTGSKTGLLAELLWGHNINRAKNEAYLYVGNFTGKNTLPVLAFPSDMKKKIKLALESYEEQYLGQVLEAFQKEVSNEDNEARRMSAITSALLEDMWYGAKFDANEETGKIQVTSKVASMDMNAIMKRRRKWLSQKTGTLINKEDLEQKFQDRQFVGTEIIENDIITNAFVFDSADTGAVTFSYKDGKQTRSVTISMRDLLVNSLGTSRTDGGTFYLIGEFDELYKHVHGALKSGALKNLYSSRPGDPTALYIKHAMHGIHRDSMLGQFMIQNNIALLISDEAAKIGGKEIKGNISDHFNNIKIGEDQILKLKMSQWERMKEEQNENVFSGNVKQLIGGVSFDDLINPIVKEAADKVGVNVNEIFQRMIARSHAQASEWFKQHNNPKAWMEILKDIISQPQSPQEQSVAAIWGNKLSPKNGLTEEDLFKKYEQTFQHPHVAEVIRNKMQQVLKNYLSGKIPGGRVALDMNMGWGNHKADVDPIINDHNFSYFLSNYEDIPSEIQNLAFPESGLKGFVSDLIELQRQESRAHAFQSGSELRQTLSDIEDNRSNVFTNIKGLNSERLSQYFSKGPGITVGECIDSTNPIVKKWKDEMIWGTEFKDTTTGEIKRRDNGILDSAGMLQKKFALLDEDTARELGLKPGDQFIPVVTPLSGSVDLGVVTLAGIVPVTRNSSGRKVADNRVAKFNSEWIQSVLGKDFDIDTISIIAYHPDYWNQNDFKNLCKVLNNTMDIYPQRMAENIKSILTAKNKLPIDPDGMPIDITAKSLFQKGSADVIRQKLGQAQMGVSAKQRRTVFPILGGSFFEIDSNYLDNGTANSVAQRRMHDIFSTLNIEAKNVGLALLEKTGNFSTHASKTNEKGETVLVPMTIDMVSRNSKWLDIHTTQGFQTHDNVDFPANTNKLTYNSDPMSKLFRVKSLQHMWGLDTDKVFNSVLSQFTGAYGQLDTLAKGLNAFSRILFNDAIQLAAGRHGETYQHLDYYQTREQIKRAKYKLNLLATKDKIGLKKLWEDVQQKELQRYAGMYEKDSSKYKEKVAVIKQQTYFVESFIENMTYDDIYAYPPFKAIQLLDPTEIPMPGNTFHDHLVKNTLATREVISYFPVAQRAYDRIYGHTSEGTIFKIPEDIAGRTAYGIMRLLLNENESIGDALGTVRWYLNKENGKERLRILTEKLDPGTKQKLRKLFIDFKLLDAKAGEPYEPIQGVNVDEENIVFSLLCREMDYYSGRAYYEKQRTDEYGIPLEPATAEKQKDSPEYWDRQLRLLRAEAASIIQAFGETIDYKPKIDPVTKKVIKSSEAVILQRKAHETSFPALFKALFENHFLFFSKGIGSETQLITRDTSDLKKAGVPIKLIPTGKGELIIAYGDKPANRWTHNELREQAKKSGSLAEAVYKLFTEPGGLWNGIQDGGSGSYNRYTASSIIQFGRNIPVEKREQILKDLLNRKLYNINSYFNLQDQQVLWLSLLSMPSEQGARDNKAIGFIFSKNRYDPENPLKFQSNSMVLDLMNVYEPQMLDDYFLHYGQTNELPIEGIDLGDLKAGLTSGNIISLDETAPPTEPDGLMRHFLSDFASRLSDITLDHTFIKFYKKMLHGSWEEGLKELRAMATNVVMLKALSENGIYYRDLVRDLKRMTNQDFYKKYGSIDATSISLAINRYLGAGIVDEFLKQRVGENPNAYNTRMNIVATYWVLNGIKKREAQGNKRLTLMRKLTHLPVGYDLLALLGEKKVFGLTARDEVVGFSFDPIHGTSDLRIEDVRIAVSPMATRTYTAQGLSSLAVTKQTRLNRALTVFQVAMNTAIDNSEEIIPLLGSKIARREWRGKYASKLKKGTPVSSRQTYITRLIDEVGEEDKRNSEVRRLQIFEMAEDLAKNFKIQLLEGPNGEISYFLNAGKGYRFNKLEKLIETHFPSLPATDKLALIAAVDLRSLYDIQVPQYIKKFIGYLETTRDELRANGGFDRSVHINDMIIKYQDMLEAITALKGNYLPHQYPISRFQEFWTKDYMEAMVWKIKMDILRNQKAKRDGDKNYNVGLANMDLVKDIKKVKEMAQALTLPAWEKISIGWNKGSIIPNFIPRKIKEPGGYTKTDPTINLNYVLKLIAGMRDDGLRADWWLYQQNASTIGERNHIVESTHNWFADQVMDTELHSKPLEVTSIKKGQQISFNVPTTVLRPGYATGSLASAVVSGVVKEITVDTIRLDIDKDKLMFDIKQDISNYENRLNSLMASGNITKKPETRQWIVLQKLFNEGYITQANISGIGKLEDFTVLDAADLIVHGLKKKMADYNNIGVYKKVDLWSYNAIGKKQDRTVNRYLHSGAIETIAGKARELKNIRLMEGHYEDAIQVAQYRALVTGSYIGRNALKGLKIVTGLLFMGLGASGKAWFNNFMGATTSNIIDAPIYRTIGSLNPWSDNFRNGQWKRAKKLWGRISHGELEKMTPEDRELYTTIVGLGLTEKQGLVSIALEAANINPEEVLSRQGTVKAIKWLATTWIDALKYAPYKKKLDSLVQAINLEDDPLVKLKLQGQLTQLEREWEGKLQKLLSSNQSSFSEAEIAAAWKKVEQLAIENKKINLSKEQGITLPMASIMIARTTWNKFYVSNFGMGLQAKAEKLRIPAFFMDYLTAMDAGFTPEEAEQLAVNGVGMRHAFYDPSHKQSGANTALGSVGFQFAQYQYNSAAHAIKLMSEAIPQMLKFAYGRDQETSYLKHAGQLLQYLHHSIDQDGKKLKRGATTLEEVNIAHTIFNQVWITAVQMSINATALVGIGSFANPIGQGLYGLIAFLIDVINKNYTGDEDRDRWIMMLDNMLLVWGMGYKMAVQATLSEKGLAATFTSGRADDTLELAFRIKNSINKIGYDNYGEGIFHKPKKEDKRDLFDVSYWTDEIASGVKWNTWMSGDPKVKTYKRAGFYPTLSTEFPYLFKEETRTLKTFGGGRYIETGGKGIGGIMNPGSAVSRLSLFFRPETYIPFMGQFQNNKKNTKVY